MATRDEIYTAIRNADAAGDTASVQKLAAYLQTMDKPAQPEPSLTQKIAGGVRDLGAGAVRGAGSIGATILYPIDKATDLIKGDREAGVTSLITGQKPLSRNEERRQAMDTALADLTGADTKSLAYQGGKLAGEIAGTAGAGGVVANALGRVPMVARGAAPLLDAIRTGGFSAGGATGIPGIAARAAGGAINGGLTAGMVNPQDAGTGAMIGGAMPIGAKLLGAGAQAAGRALRGGGASPEVSALAERANQLGIQIPADRLVNSKPLNALASSLEYLPLSGRGATMGRMQDQLKTAVSRTFGQDSSNVTQALRTADKVLGDKFDDVLKSNAVRVDKQLLDDMAQSVNVANKELPADSAKVISSQVDELVSKAQNGAIDGQAAYNIKKALDRIGKQQGVGFYARDLKDKLMDALNRSLPDGGKEFAELRKQYGNMRTLEKIAQNGAEGDISIGRLANMKNIGNKDVQELADISAQFLKTRENPHGAMQRAFIGGAGLGTAGGIPLLVGGATAGRGINSLLNSGMVRNAVLNGAPSPAIENALAKILQLTYRTAPVVSAQ